MPSNQFQTEFDALGIDPVQFDKIATLELKKRYLRFKFLNIQFNAIKSNASFEEAENAYKTLQSAPEIINHQDKLSPHSRGLHYLNYYQKNDQPFIKIKDMAEGVEPKYTAASVEDILFFIDDTCSNINEKIKFITTHEKKLLAVYRRNSQHIPKYLVKFDYKNITDDNIVSADLENLRNTNTMTNIKDKFGDGVGEIAVKFFNFAKSGKSNKKIIEASLENLGNDFSIAMGIDTQEQKLWSHHYKNGSIKIMPVGLWNNNAKPLTIGGDDGDNKVCIEDVILKQGKIKSISDPSLKIAHILLIYILFADRDAIGSRGQNKLRELSKIFAIDHGHLAEIEDILEYITPQFHFEHDKKKFKNYSIFYDASRSEIIKGLLLLAKMLGKNVADSIIESYDSEFQEHYKRVEPNSLNNIFNDYEKTFTELATQANGYNQKGLKGIAKKISATSTTFNQNHNAIVHKFRNYLHLTAKEIDLVENIEKVLHSSRRTTLRSPDKTCLLNHLAITKYSIKAFTQTKSENSIELSFRFKDDDFAGKAIKNLKEWSTRKPNEQPSIYSCNLKNDTLTISFAPDSLEKMYELFGEHEIMKAYHPDDYKLQQYYHAEKELRSKIDKFKFADVHLKQVSNESLRLTIKPNSLSFDADVTENARKLLNPEDDALVCDIKVSVDDYEKPFQRISYTLEALTDLCRNNEISQLQAEREWLTKYNHPESTELTINENSLDERFQHLLRFHLNSRTETFTHEGNAYQVQNKHLEAFYEKINKAENEYNDSMRQTDREKQEIDVLKKLTSSFISFSLDTFDYLDYQLIIQTDEAGIKELFDNYFQENNIKENTFKLDYKQLADLIDLLRTAINLKHWLDFTNNLTKLKQKYSFINFTIDRKDSEISITYPANTTLEQLFSNNLDRCSLEKISYENLACGFTKIEIAAEMAHFQNEINELFDKILIPKIKSKLGGIDIFRDENGYSLLMNEYLRQKIGTKFNGENDLGRISQFIEEEVNLYKSLQNESAKLGLATLQTENTWSDKTNEEMKNIVIQFESDNLFHVNLEDALQHGPIFEQLDTEFTYPDLTVLLQKLEDAASKIDKMYCAQEEANKLLLLLESAELKEFYGSIEFSYQNNEYCVTLNTEVAKLLNLEAQNGLVSNINIDQFTKDLEQQINLSEKNEKISNHINAFNIKLESYKNGKDKQLKSLLACLHLVPEGDGFKIAINESITTNHPNEAWFSKLVELKLNQIYKAEDLLTLYQSIVDTTKNILAPLCTEKFKSARLLLSQPSFTAQESNSVFIMDSMSELSLRILQPIFAETVQQIVDNSTFDQALCNLFNEFAFEVHATELKREISKLHPHRDTEEPLIVEARNLIREGKSTHALMSTVLIASKNLITNKLDDNTAMKKNHAEAVYLKMTAEACKNTTTEKLGRHMKNFFFMVAAVAVATLVTIGTVGFGLPVALDLYSIANHKRLTLFNNPIINAQTEFAKNYSPPAPKK